MTIKEISIPGGIVLDGNSDEAEIVKEFESRIRTLPVGVHNITPPHMAEIGYNREVLVFEDGTGILKGTGQKPMGLKHEGDRSFLGGRGQTPQEFRIYGVVYFEKGASPKK